MKTSVIICFYERLDLLKACLESLRSSHDDFHEVVVADDGSSAEVVLGVKEMIKLYDFPVTHAWHPRNGPRRSATRNTGIRSVSGDYLIFLDADFAVLPGTVNHHNKAAKLGYFAAGRCKYTTEEQCRSILENGPSELLLEKIYSDLPEEPINKEHHRFLKYALLHRLRLSSPRKVTFGGHFSAFRQDIETVNGYDENFIGWGGEDLDFALRMVLAGFRGTSIIRTARILHLWHPREIGNTHWKEGSNMNYFTRKNIPAFCENGLTKKSSSPISM